MSKFNLYSYKTNFKRLSLYIGLFKEHVKQIDQNVQTFVW